MGTSWPWDGPMGGVSSALVGGVLRLGSKSKIHSMRRGA